MSTRPGPTLDSLCSRLTNKGRNQSDGFLLLHAYTIKIDVSHIYYKTAFEKQRSIAYIIITQNVTNKRNQYKFRCDIRWKARFQNTLITPSFDAGALQITYITTNKVNYLNDCRKNRTFAATQYMMLIASHVIFCIISRS